MISVAMAEPCSTRLPRMALLGLVLAFATGLAAQLGAVPIAAADWLTPPWHTGSEPLSGSAYVLWQLRLPRLPLALAVAWCGSIGFIGLMAPHLARQLVGANARQVLPASALCGALLLVAADTLARTLAVPAEIPVGICSALIGAPWFLFLLRGALRRMGTA